MKLVGLLHQAVQRDDDFSHAGHPLIQRLHAKRGFLLDFEQREIWRLLADAGVDIVVEVSSVDVALYGSTEAALKRVGARVSGYRWQHLVAGPVEARSRTNPFRMAWMHLHVRCARRFAALIRHELAQRGGRMTGAQFNENVVRLAGHAPLAGLIGYADWVSRHSDGKGSVECRFAEWRIAETPPGPPGPRAA